MSIATHDYIDEKSGRITQDRLAYYAATGYPWCGTGQNTNLQNNYRAFFNFDTSGLPDNSLVMKVEFLVRLSLTQPFGNPQTYRLRASIGTFIGDALDGTGEEFEAGTPTLVLTEKPTDNVWLDLHGTLDPTSFINLQGDTDIKLWDDSDRGDGDVEWGIAFDRFDKELFRCRLRITYVVPGGTATGFGRATCAFRTMTTLPLALSQATRVTQLRDSGQSHTIHTDEATGTPCCVDQATISARRVNQATRSPLTVHAASRKCIPDDTALRGPRRYD